MEILEREEKGKFESFITCMRLHGFHVTDNSIYVKYFNENFVKENYSYIGTMMIFD